LDGGVIITASHNPPEFNGIKFKTALAAPADDDTTKTIESLIGSARPKETDFELALRDKRIRFLDVDNDYIDFLRSYVDIERIKKARHLNILVDYMHGVGAGYIERILGKIAGHIDVIRDSANPLFGGVNPEPIPKNMEHSLELTKRKKIDLGIALDGDADRIGAIRPDGRYITSGQIISLILLHLLEERNLCGAVVKTISGTALLDRICDRFGLSLFETPVGFKHISSLMLRENILIGGEESGGIGFCGYIPERDGILSALLLIEMLAVKNRSIIAIMNGIEKEYGRFCYDRLDISYPQHKANLLSKRLRSNPPHTIAGKKIIKMKTYDGIKFIMQDSSWLLLRFSGTEPLIRIYAESNSEDNVKMLLSAGKKILRY
jgi:phosphomannomutase